MHLQHNPEIVAFIDRLAETGSNYQMGDGEPLYGGSWIPCPDTRRRAIARFSKEEMFAEFRSRRDAGEKPLSTAKKVLHIEEQGHEATAILYRQMGDRASPAFYELRLRRVDGEWRVAGETVLPWPDLGTVKSFLPPREK